MQGEVPLAAVSPLQRQRVAAATLSRLSCNAFRCRHMQRCHAPSNSPCAKRRCAGQQRDIVVLVNAAAPTQRAGTTESAAAGDAEYSMLETAECTFRREFVARRAYVVRCANVGAGC